MEKIFFVESGDLYDVNRELEKGGRIKSITALSKNITSFGYAGGRSDESSNDYWTGEIFAYIVVEYDRR